jgi:glycosyltransferase domain-containing protein
MKKKSDITFLLLIKDRPFFFNRWLKFHANELEGVQLFISDGGRKSIFCEDLEILKRKKNIKYYKFDFDKNYKIFIKKVYLSLKKIKTKYTIFCSDDDFLNLNSIIYAKNRIAKKNYFSSVQANFLSFQGFDKFNRIFSIPSGLSFMRFIGKTHVNKSKHKKIKNFFSDPAGAFHFLTKTSLLREAYKTALKSKIFNSDLLDLLVNIIIHSKAHILKTNSIFHMHQYHEKSEAHQRSYKNLIERKFNKQIQELINVASKKLNLTKDLFKKDFLEFHYRTVNETPRFRNQFNIWFKNFILNKFIFKLFFKKYYFNKALKEKNNFIKLKKIRRKDYIFINNVYSFFIKNY